MRSTSGFWGHTDFELIFSSDGGGGGGARVYKTAYKIFQLRKTEKKFLRKLLTVNMSDPNCNADSNI